MQETDIKNIITMNSEATPKKVLFIAASLIRAGAETQLVNLINLLDANKFQKHLFTYHKRIDLYERLDHQHIQFYNRPRKHKFHLAFIKDIVEIIDKQHIQIVHCTNFFSTLIGWMAIRFAKNKPKLIAAIHTTTTQSAKFKIAEILLYRWVLRACARVIFVCKNQARHWITKHPFLKQKSIVIYNGIDPERFNPGGFNDTGVKFRRRLNIPENAPVICCIARFRREKAHENLIEAFDALNGNAYLILAGDGERKTHIESLVQSKGLQEQIKFTGSVDDVRPVLAASDISVLASTEVETFPMSVLESLSMGVAVIATDIGGLSEVVIPRQTGYLVSPGDASAIAEKIATMINDPKQLCHIKKNGRQMIKQHFSSQHMVSATESLLLSLDLA